MKKPDKPAAQDDKTLVRTQDTDPTTQDASASQLNSPKLDDEGKPTQKAVSSARQAHAIAKALFQRAKEGRIKTAAVILAKYNGESPYNQRDLKESGQGWRNNFSTNFLASIIDRVKPQLLDPIQNAPSLTRSALPVTVEEAASKSRVFCNEITKTIRKWSGWTDFCSMLAQENVCFGVATPAWIDKDEWRPKLYRFDECFLPEGTGQHAAKVQCAPFTQSILLHDFLGLFQDKDAAELAGYNVEGCIAVANSSYGQEAKEVTGVTLEDAKREQGPMYDTYANSQTRTVELYHLLVREYDGGVDLWTVANKDGTLVRHIPHIFETMEEAITLFTLQTGNTKFYGSKGLGRLLTNLHIAIERGRCLAKDQEYLSGLTIMTGDQKDFNAFQPTVKHPFILVNKDFKIEKAGVEFNTTEWLAMDNKLVELAESIAGAFIPPNLEQDSGANTKIEAAARAEREVAVRKGVLGRFVNQFYDLVWTIQKKICSKENLKEAVRVFKDNTAKEQGGKHVIARKVWKLLEGIVDDIKELFSQEIEVKIADPEAVECIVSMLKQGLDITEIAQLALAPAAPQEETESDGGDANTLQFITANAQNPLLDQKEAFKMAGEILVGKDRTEQLISDKSDPTVQAEAVRMQLMELGMLQGGNPMPVAPTDAHDIHRNVIRTKFGPFLQAMAVSPTPPMIQAADLTIAHYGQHLEMDRFTPPDQKKQEAQQISQWQQISDNAKKALVKAAQAAQAHGLPPGTPLPPAVQGAPTGAGPDGQMVGDPGDREKLGLDVGATAADIKLRTNEQILRKQELDLKARELALKEGDQAHRHSMEKAKFELEQHKTAFDATIKAHETAQGAIESDRSHALATQQATQAAAEAAAGQDLEQQKLQQQEAAAEAAAQAQASSTAQE